MQSQPLIPPPIFSTFLGLLSALYLLPFSPFLIQETPSGLNWKSDLSSPVWMLHWDVPASLSPSLHSPFIPKHKYNLPHVLWLASFFCTLFFFEDLEVPDGPLEGQWCNQLLISHLDWQLTLLQGGGRQSRGSACRCCVTSWFNFKTATGKRKESSLK